MSDPVLISGPTDLDPDLPDAPPSTPIILRFADLAAEISLGLQQDGYAAVDWTAPIGDLGGW